MKPLGELLNQVKTLKTYTIIKAATITLAATFVVIAATTTMKKKVHAVEFDKAFTPYISAYTSGLVPKNSRIQVRFASDVAQADEVGKEIPNKLFEFSPAIEGKMVWVDTRTVEFKPTAMLKSGQVYDGELNMSGVIDTIPSKLGKFPFQIRTRNQDFSFQTDGVKPMPMAGTAWEKIEGTIETLEFEDNTGVEKILQAEHNGKKLHIKWRHAEDGIKHTYEIDSIERKAKKDHVDLIYNGDPIQVEKKGKQEQVIPALGDFTLTNSQSFSNPEQYIQLQFSDPIDATQDLNGLITAEETSFKFAVEDGTVKGFPTNKLTKAITVTIHPGIRNNIGYKKNDEEKVDLEFEEIYPQIKELGNGSIIPRSDGTIPFPFEAVNLKAVDVRITKIYEKNVLQFLQYNTLKESEYLDFVGKVVFERKVFLTNDPSINLGKWNRHALDLAKLINPEPGAIYNIQIRFRKEYSLYNCVDTAKNKRIKEEKYDLLTRESGSQLWKIYEDYYGYYDEDEGEDGNRWSEHQSPCSKWYYINNRGINRNVLASDLGMIAKRGTDGSCLVAVSDLRNTNPIPNVPIEVYDFQKQLIANATTDAQGFARFSTKDEPFVIIGKNGSERGYLKLKNSELSLSKFDISGMEYHKGVKGFIYADRGVWRPGDSIYITFILEDKERVLPVDYPIVFEFTNPMGQTVNKVIRKNSVNGFYSFYCVTDENAVTGGYTAHVNVGGVTFEKNIRVETIVPNRLKLNMDFANKYLEKSSANVGNLTVKWLHGAPGKGLNTSVSVYLSKTINYFENYKEYCFNDPVKKFAYESSVIFEGKTDADGKVSIPDKITLSDYAPGPLEATFYCKATEPGGNFSSDNFTTTLHPYNQYVGIKTEKGEGDPGVLLTDQVHNIDVITIDKNAKPVNSTVEVYLYKMEWRWWWDLQEEGSSYNGREYNNPVVSTTINTVNGHGTWQIKMPSEQYGRYLIRAIDKQGHITGKIVYIDRPGWYNRRDENTEGTAFLTISSNKKSYRTGETAILDIPTAYSGSALVTIESSTKVLSAQWIKAAKGHTKFNFTITPEMSPNVYASVIFVQPHAQTINDLPIRLYGVAPITVDNPASHVDPVIILPKEIQPEQKLNLFVKEKNGKAMTYTIAMVDEGLLDLTHFQTPDPWKAFNAKEALNVTYWDLYDAVLGNYMDKVKKLLTIGGDGAGLYAGDGTKVQRFKPMVRFIGPFNLAPNGTARHIIQMPRYIGSVRTMIIAGNNGAYGSAEETTPVRKPLMVLGTLPRVLGPDEEVDLPVTIFAMNDNIKNVNVELKVNDLLNVRGPKTQTVHFDKQGEAVINFPIKVSTALGAASAQIIASCGAEIAKYDIELAVRAPNPYETKTDDAIVKDGENKTFNYNAFGINGTNKITLEVSSVPALNLESRLNYLIEYPHGCIEQTTSSVFPQLYIPDLITLSTEKKNETEKNIRAGIHRLMMFQLPSGGMSYWPTGGYSEADDWGTNYAGNFLLEAQIKGYNIPAGMLDKWKTFQKSRAIGWSYLIADNTASDHQLTQAYRLYLLALAKAPELGAMNRLREVKNLSITATWELAAAYYLAGQKTVAASLIRNLTIDIPRYSELYYTYGSDTRDKAIILETVQMLGDKEKAFKLAVQLSNIMKSERWMSTQETAYSLMALSKYGKGLKGIDIEYRINGTEWKKISSNVPIAQLKLDLSKASKGKIELRNAMKQVIYANLVTRGIPLAGQEKNEDRKIKMSVSYTDLKGNEINVNELEQGTDFIAEFKVENPEINDDYKNMALTAIFPSGWQIYNPRMTGDQFTVKTSTPDYMDVRDDRVKYYFDIDRRVYYSNHVSHNDNSRTFRIAMNASFTGKFYLPSTYCEAMYDNTIHSIHSGRWIKVTKPKNHI